MPRCSVQPVELLLDVHRCVFLDIKPLESSGRRVDSSLLHLFRHSEGSQLGDPAGNRVTKKKDG